MKDGAKETGCTQNMNRTFVPVYNYTQAPSLCFTWV